MNANIDKDTERIEAYLSGNMSSDERLGFESALNNDQALRDLFGLYQSVEFEMTRSAKYSDRETTLKNTLQNLNATYFKTEALVVRLKRFRRLYKVATAAAVVVALMVAGYYLFVNNDNGIRQLADTYVQNDLSHLSITMDGAQDSMQQGIAAYNKKDYTKAVQLFEAVYTVHPDNNDALKYTGITYLVTKEYDRALACFDELSAKKGLFSNPGLFLKAVTLLQRNQAGDRAQAEQLLQQVVNEKSEGSREAAGWLQ